MRRRFVAAIASLSLVALVGTSAIAAPPAGMIRARASAAAEAGGKILLKAKVIRPDQSATFSASAVVTLDGGAVPVDLRLAGKRSFLALKKVAIPAEESLGCKTVEITVNYGATTEVFTRMVSVVAEGTDLETAPACV